MSVQRPILTALAISLCLAGGNAAAQAPKKAPKKAAAPEATAPAPAVAPTPAPAATPAAKPAAAAAPSFDEQFQAARALVRDGKREEALAAYTALLKRSPGNSDVLLARGRLYGWMDRWAESEKDLTAATRASPNYADAWSALGDLYRWTDRPTEAAAAYAHWSQVAPQDPAPHLARGRVLRQSGNIESARAEFEAARSLNAPADEVEKAFDSLRTTTSLAPDATAPLGYKWSATLSGSDTSVSGGGISDYQNYGLAVRRHFEHGSLAVEALGVHRFGTKDTAYALDGYHSLWDRAYANARLQVSGDNPGLFPRNSGRFELYQGVGKGWELAASEDWLHFASTKVNIYGLAVAKYWSNYYGRLRGTYVDTSGSIGWRLTLRDYYQGDADHYFELAGGTSRGDITSRGVTALQWSESVSVAWVTFIRPSWGVKIGADYSSSDHTEDGISAALYVRW